MGYTISREPSTGKARILRDADGATIPEDPRNGDYQAYLVWRAAQPNPPDDADGPPPPQPKPPKGVEAIAAILDQAAGTAKGRAAVAAMEKRMLIDWIRANPDDAKAIALAAGLSFDPRE